MFPPQSDFSQSKKIAYDILPENRFEIVFEETYDQKQISVAEDKVISIYLYS